MTGLFAVIAPFRTAAQVNPQKTRKTRKRARNESELIEYARNLIAASELAPGAAMALPQSLSM